MVDLRLIHPVLAVTPLMILHLRLVVIPLLISPSGLRTTGWSATLSPWTPAVVAVLALTDVLLAGLLERHFLREPTASRLRAQGKIPEELVALVGMFAMVAPTCWALFATFVGLSLTQLVWYAAASVVGVAWWGWRYRRVIYAI